MVVKIALLAQEAAPWGVWGGIGTYAASTAAGLAAAGHEVTVISEASTGQPLDFRTRGVRWYAHRPWPRSRQRLRARSMRVHDQLRATASAARALHELGESFDVIESPEWLAEGLAHFTLHRSALRAVHLHGGVRGFAAHDATWTCEHFRAASAIEGLLVASADVVTACSRLAASDAAGRALYRARTARIPMPVDTENWPQQAYEASEGHVLFVGSLIESKRPELLVAAVSRLPRRSRPHLRFVGKSFSDDMRVRLLQHAAASDVSVSIADHLKPTDLRTEYAHASVVVLPSRWETFGLVAAEAMSSARPVIVTSGCGVADTIVDHGGGVVVPVDDAGALAAAIQDVLQDRDAASVLGRRGADVVRRVHAVPVSTEARLTAWASSPRRRR